MHSDITSFLPFIVTGLIVSALHAALPTHWLPFVLAARSQKWSFPKTVSILLIAGIGHILTTALIGAALVWFGLKISDALQNLLVLAASLSLFLFGVYYLFQSRRGFSHAHCTHNHPHTHDYKESSNDGWAILSLLTLLTFSPCESFVPVYVSAWSLGWFGFFGLTIVLAIGTLSAMIIFMSLAYFGFRQMNLNWLERREKLIIGIVLILFSFAVYYLEAGHHHAH
jgi:nickel/cobalt transporter (NicO) family protein